MIEINIHEVRQKAGGGGSVVIFNAELDLHSDGPVTVNICSVEPKDTEPELIEEARQAIRRGIEDVLTQQARGASMRVIQLFVHPIHFKPSRSTLLTALELKRLVR